MTLKELEAKLESLSDDEFSDFVHAFGGGHQTRNQVVRAFVDHPEFERRLCQLLGLATQDERLVEATRSSARSAQWSMVWACCGFLVALAALVISMSK